MSLNDNIVHQEDKELFLQTLNKRGFLLEDKTWKIISENIHFRSLETNKIINHGEEKVEVDLIVLSGRHHLVIECKKTDYSWIFTRPIERPETLNLLYDSDGGIKVRSRSTSDFKVAWSGMALMFNEDGRLARQNRNRAQTTERDDIYEHIKQVLKETEFYICTNRQHPSNLSDTPIVLTHIIIPIIVTNARLGYLEYSKGDLSSNGDLINYSNIKEVEGIVYNFPQIMKWDYWQQTVENLGGTLNQHHIKSIFIVNINYLSEFIKKILDQELTIR